MNNHVFFKHRQACLWVLCSMLLSCGPALANTHTAKKHHRAKSSHVTHLKKTSQVASSWPVVHINIASTDDLMKLKGMSRRRARAIVKYRQAQGGFKQLNDLLKVKGMSHAAYLRLVKLNGDHLRL